MASSTIPSASRRLRSWTTGARFGYNGSVSCLHVRTTVAFVGADRPRSAGAVTKGVAQSACAFQLAEDFFFVVEEVADEAVAVALVHRESGFDAGAEDAGCQCLREGGDEGFVG